MTADIQINITAQDNFSNVLGSFGNIITGIESAINLVGDAFRLAGDAIMPFINSASESQQAIFELEAILQATGGAAGFTSQELQDMASALQGVTSFSDETIMSGQAMLLTFRNIGEDTFPRATQAMLDMGAMFGNVDQAAVQLGKALNDPIAGIGALSRIGIQFTEEQKEMIANFMEMGDVAAAQNVILTEVEMQLGGLAEAMGGTFAGQLEIAKNKLDEFREIIGAALLPTLTGLLTKLSEFASQPAVIQFFEDLGASISVFIDNLDLADRLENFLGLITDAMETGNWQPVWDAIVTAFETIKDRIVELFSGSSGFDVQGTIQGLVDRLSNAIAAADWTAVGRTAADVFSAALTIALEGLDIIVNQIDWRPLGVALSAALGQLLQGVFSSESLQAIAISWHNWVNDAFHELGVNIVEGLVAGMQTTFLTSMEIVLRPFRGVIEAVKALFGIASPSTVFAGIGRDIVLGLIAGFGGMWGTFATFVIGLMDGLLGNLSIGNILDALAGGGGLGGASGSVSGLGSGPGTTGGRDMGGTSTGAGPGGGVINNYYGPVYFQGAGEPGAYYECPSDSPLTAGGGLRQNRVGV